MESGNQKLILALDTPDRHSAFQLLQTLDGLIRQVKVGPGLFFQEGPLLIHELRSRGYKVFLDFKLHDIPNTVSLAVKSARKLGVWMLSLHLSGGKAMLKQAVQEAEGSLLLVGITVLTSLTHEDLIELGISDSPQKQTVRLGQLAKEAGLKGIVASPQEVHSLRETLGKDLLFIAPGIRAGSQKIEDQARTSSAAEAVKAGADYLVIGRPILQAKNPREAALAILKELNSLSQDEEES